MRDTVCFDLDGTLLDPGTSIRQAIQFAVRQELLAEFAPEEVLIGMPLREILRRRTQDAQAIERMVEAFRHHYLDDAWQHVPWFEGAEAVVRRCRDEGMQTAIVTTKGEAEAVHLMQKLGVADLWDAIVGDDDVRPVKPDPGPVLTACRRLGRHPQEVAMVGDTSFDVEAGRRAGTHTIGVRWGTGWKWDAAPDQAHVVVDDAHQLWQAIDRWRG